jgi:hypothetical protein
MFKNLQELITSMPDAKSCKKFLEQQRWQNGITCPYCGHAKCYIIENNERYKCASKTCYKRFTVLVGTIFEASKIPLNKWMIAVYLNTAHKKGISSCQLARDLGVTQKTAWFMLHRIREGVRAKMPVRLKNNVQMDEAFFGGTESNMHKDKKSKTKAQMNQRKTPVFGIIEEGGKVVVQATKWMSKRNAETLLLTHVDKEATLVTDAFKMYKIIGAKHFKKHVSVNHLQGEFKVDGYHTNGIENFWSQMKRSVYGIYHQVSSKHLQRYCDEMAYRFNSRKIKDSERFTIALQNCQGRLKYNTLLNNSLTLNSYGKEIKEIGNQEN